MSIKIPGKQGQSLLHLAARRNLSGLCRWLLRFGANVDRTDILGRTALHYAAQQGSTETMRLLIAHGAKLTEKDWKGKTPFDLLPAGGCGDELRLTIEEAISLRHSHRVKGAKRWRDRRNHTA